MAKLQPKAQPQEAPLAASRVDTLTAAFPLMLTHKVGDRYYELNDGWDVGRAYHKYVERMRLPPPPLGPGSAIEAYWRRCEAELVVYLRNEASPEELAYYKGFSFTR
jgi:hypothetical protein